MIEGNVGWCDWELGAAAAAAVGCRWAGNGLLLLMLVPLLLLLILLRLLLVLLLLLLLRQLIPRVVHGDGDDLEMWTKRTELSTCIHSLSTDRRLGPALTASTETGSQRATFLHDSQPTSTLPLLPSFHYNSSCLSRVQAHHDLVTLIVVTIDLDFTVAGVSGIAASL